MTSLLGGNPQQSQQGTLIPGTITSINPTLCLIDGSATPMAVLTGHPYAPLPGDRVGLTKFGQQYLAIPVDMGLSANTVDDLWHPVGDVGEPAYLNGFTDRGDAGGSFYGDTTRFTRDRAGVVWIEGLINMPTPHSGLAIFQLPPGYRPAYQLVFPCVTGNAIYQIGVDPSGMVYVQYSATFSAGSYLSLDSVSFMAEDGPNPPVWHDLSSCFQGTWQASSGTFASTLAGATGTPYPGARWCVDSVGDIHVSGICSQSTASSAGSTILAFLETTGGMPASAYDTDFVTSHMWLASANGAPGFARLDLQTTNNLQLAVVTYGNGTASSAWFSLDAAAWPQAPMAGRWKSAVYINSWVTYTASAWPDLSFRMNKIGTVYSRGLVHGTAASIASAAPAYGSGKVLAPNVNKIFPAVCVATAGNGANRTDIAVGGWTPGLVLFTGQAAGTSTTTYTSCSFRWSTKPYHA